MYIHTSFARHNRYDISTSASDASSGSLYVVTMSAAACEGRNSNTPSDAIMKNLQDGSSCLTNISASALTPSPLAMASPMDLRQERKM